MDSRLQIVNGGVCGCQADPPVSQPGGPRRREGHGWRCGCRWQWWWARRGPKVPALRAGWRRVGVAAWHKWRRMRRDKGARGRMQEAVGRIHDAESETAQSTSHSTGVESKGGGDSRSLHSLCRIASSSLLCQPITSARNVPTSVTWMPCLSNSALVSSA